MSFTHLVVDLLVCAGERNILYEDISDLCQLLALRPLGEYQYEGIDIARMGRDARHRRCQSRRPLGRGAP